MSLQQRLTNFGFACTFSYDVGGQERSRADAFITLLLFIDRSSGGDRGRVRKKGIGKMPVNIDVLWKLLILTKYFRVFTLTRVLLKQISLSHSQPCCKWTRRPTRVLSILLHICQHLTARVQLQINAFYRFEYNENAFKNLPFLDR